MCSDLTTELRSNRTSATGNHNNLVVNKIKDFGHICLDRFSSEEILYLYCTKVTFCYNRSIRKLIHTWDILNLTVCRLADLNNVTSLGSSSGRECDIDLLNIVLHDILHDIITTTDNRYAIYRAMPLIRIIINDTCNMTSHLFGMTDITKKHLATGTRADDHDGRADIAKISLMNEKNKTISKADPKGE